MKKNLITVLILAISIINLVFNILLVFVFMPSANKTNKLITDIAKVLDLEIASQSNGDNTFDVSNLVYFKLEQGNPINLAADGTNESHVLQYGITINLDKTSSDYSKTESTLTESKDMIYDITRNIIGRYTYAQVVDVNVQNQSKEDVLQALKQTFNS